LHNKEQAYNLVSRRVQLLMYRSDLMENVDIHCISLTIFM
jgi:hypothetical protein